MFVIGVITVIAAVVVGIKQYRQSERTSKQTLIKESHNYLSFYKVKISASKKGSIPEGEIKLNYQGEISDDAESAVYKIGFYFHGEAHTDAPMQEVLLKKFEFSFNTGDEGKKIKQEFVAELADGVSLKPEKKEDYCFPLTCYISDYYDNDDALKALNSTTATGRFSSDLKIEAEIAYINVLNVETLISHSMRLKKIEGERGLFEIHDGLKFESVGIKEKDDDKKS